MKHECLSPKEMAAAAQAAIRRSKLARHHRFPEVREDGEVILNKGEYVARMGFGVMSREMERGHLKECAEHPGRYVLAA